MAGLFVTDITPEQVANARKWIDALRSGKYKQTRQRLRRNDRYCCLGVGLDTTGADWEVTRSSLGVEHFRGYLALQKLVGLVDPGGARRNEPGLTYLNDVEWWSFTRIADVIEEELNLALGKVPA